MKKQLLPLAAVLTTLSGSVHAQTIFFQDFESGLSAKESVGGSFRINNTNAQKPPALPIIEETKFPLFVPIVVREQIAHEIAQRLHDHPVHRPERDRLAPCLPLWPRVADLPELRLVPVPESVKDPSPSAPEIVPGMPSGVRSARPAALSGWRKPARKTQSA